MLRFCVCSVYILWYTVYICSVTLLCAIGKPWSVWMKILTQPVVEFFRPDRSFSLFSRRIVWCKGGNADIFSLMPMVVQKQNCRIRQPFNNRCEMLNSAISWTGTTGTKSILHLRRARARRIYLFPSVSKTCTCGLFGIFHLFTLFLEEFDYTAGVQHALVAVERK